MSLTAIQTRTIEAIIQIFETSKYTPDSYGAIANMKGDTGGISFGTHMASIASGNLYLLLNRYIEAKGIYAKEFDGFMITVKAKDKKIGQNTTFKALLAKSATDPIMQMTQDAFFYDQFMKPSVLVGQKYGFIYALSYGVLFDSFIQGAFSKIRDRTNTAARINEERKWISTYLETRKSWLQNTSPLLAKTTYRADTFLSLIKSKNWALDLPFSCHGVKLTANLLQFKNSDSSKTTVDLGSLVKADETPVLIRNEDNKKATNPKTDMEILQTALLKKGFYTFKVDGLFGKNTEEAVKNFQKSVGLKVDGIVGNNTRLALGIL